MERIRRVVTASPALRRLLLDHRECCTADCCKEKAFRITEASIARWLGHERIDRTREMAEEIRRIHVDVQEVEGWVLFEARGLESEWGADAFRAFWGRLKSAFTRAVETDARTSA
jgi:hypothetical protein